MFCLVASRSSSSSSSSSSKDGQPSCAPARTEINTRSMEPVRYAPDRHVRRLGKREAKIQRDTFLAAN